METSQKSRRSPQGILTIGPLLVFLLLLSASEVVAADQLSAVTVDRGNASRTIVGVIQSESPEFVVHELKTNQDLTFEKSEIRQIRRDIGEDNAARLIGVAPILARKLTTVLPEEAKAGKVATVDGRSVYVTFGENSGIKADDKLVVYRQGKVIVNPDTGDVLGQERRKIAELLVTSVEEKYCKTLFATDIEVELKPGDLVEPASAKNALAVFPLVDQRQVVTKGGVQVAEELTGALVAREVTVVERIRLLDAIKELNLQQTTAFDEKTVQKVGNHLGAFAIVTGSVTHSRTSSKVNIRLIEVATGKVLFAQTFTVGKLDTTPAVLFGAMSSVEPTPSAPQYASSPSEILRSSLWKWTKPARLGPPINTKYHETAPAISADGLTLVFSSDRPGGYSDSWDLWASTRPTTRSAFSDPKNLGATINKGGATNPTLTADGLTLFFNSNRPGTLGTEGYYDIWMATRPTIDSDWNEPVNLGAPVNSKWFDSQPSISSDGLTLIFTSNRPGVQEAGQGDIWITTRESFNAAWQTPTNLNRGINNPPGGHSPTLLSDGLTILFADFEPGNSNNRKLWAASRVSPESPFEYRRLLPATVNGEKTNVDSTLTSDGRIMFFRSNRRGSEGWDIWWTQRVPK